jgi:regulator of sigma E protease
MELLTQLAIGILGLGFMIFIHELGHFAVAKWAKVKVNTFSIGFGPKLLQYKYGDTTYCISAIPFGGYVAMENETPTDATRSYSEGDFANKPIWVRAAIAFAGPAVNIVFAFGLLWVLYMIGVPEPKDKDLIVGRVAPASAALESGVKPGDRIISVNGRIPKDWEMFMEEVAMSLEKEIPLRVQRGSAETTMTLRPKEMERKGQKLGVGDAGIWPGGMVTAQGVFAGSPAQLGGVQVGDTLLALNGVRLYGFYDFVEMIQKGQPVVLTVGRATGPAALQLVPKRDADTIYRVGVQLGLPMETKSYDALSALSPAWDKSLNMAMAPIRFIERIFSGGIKVEAMSGPVGIAQVMGKTFEAGMLEFAFLMALISMNLGVMNLLPLAITDGGILMFLALEAIRGKPLSPAVQGVIQRIAVVFFLTLFAYILVQDLFRIPLFLD